MMQTHTQNTVFEIITIRICLVPAVSHAEAGSSYLMLAPEKAACAALNGIITQGCL